MNKNSVRVSVRMLGDKAKKMRRFSSWAKQRVADHFSRFSEYVRSVDVFFRDLNGPKGGYDQNLMLAVRLRGGGTIGIRAVGNDINKVLDNGIDRGLFTLSRKIEKTKNRRVARWKYVPEWIEPEVH